MSATVVSLENGSANGDDYYCCQFQWKPGREKETEVIEDAFIVHFRSVGGFHGDQLAYQLKKIETAAAAHVGHTRGQQQHR